MPGLGSSSNAPNPNPRPVHGPLWFDARDYGVLATNADNTAALQAAIDAAAAAAAAYTGRNALATIFIPAAKTAYYFRDPVFADANAIRVLGEGDFQTHGTLLAKAGGYASPLFMVGLSRAYGGVVPNATYRPDLWNGGNPKLDGTVVTAANQKWGIRTNGDLVLMSVGSAFTHGGQSAIYSNQVDYWQETDYLTFEMAIEGFSSGKVPAGTIFANNSSSQASPLVLRSTGNGGYTLYVGYQTAKYGAISVNSYTFSSGAATGVVKLTIQVNLIAGTVRAAFNGTWVTVTGSALPAGARFPEPGDSPGSNLPACYWNAETSYSAPTNADFAIYGQSQSKTLKYADTGVGTSQIPNPQIGVGGLTVPAATGGTYTITYKGQTTAPLAYNATASQVQAALQALSTIGAGNATAVAAQFTYSFNLTGSNGVVLTGSPAMCDGTNLTGTTIPDAYRYFAVRLNQATPGSVDPWDIGHFLFTENPATNTRHLNVNGNFTTDARSSVFLLNAHTLDPITSGTYFENIAVAGGNTYGTGILRAHVLDQHHGGVQVSGGLWGVADFAFGANYTNYFHDCQITGADAGLNMYWSEVILDTVTFLNNGKWTLRLTGCQLDAQHINVTSTGLPQNGFCRIAGGIYGGLYDIAGLSVDNEGVDYGVACFYAERHAYTPVRLTVKNVYMGLPGNCDLFQLKDVSNTTTWPIASLAADFISVDNFGAMVSVDGPGWTFTVTNTGVDGGSDVVNLAKYPGNPRGKVEGTAKLPSRYGQSWPGASAIRNPGPSDGQFATLMPATTGTWGSPTPAKWAGIGPLIADQTASLAAYAVDHTAFGATLSGQAASFGYLTTSSTNGISAPTSVANTLFGGPIAGTATTLNLYGAGLGGTFTLSYGGQTTAPLAYNAPAATIQAALQGLSSVGAGNMTVSGSSPTYTITLAGSLARLAGGVLGIAVNGAGLTATGGQAVLTGSVLGLYGAGLGGTFTLTNGSTTPALAYNASAQTIANALQALGYPYSAYAGVGGAPGGPYSFTQSPSSVNGAGLTATGGQAVLTPAGLPSTWYVGLLTYPARKRTYPIAEAGTAGSLAVPASGCIRQPLPNSLSGFTAASAGSKASAATLTFPAATNAYTVTAIGLFDAPVGGNCWAQWQLATPLVVAQGVQPTIASGAMTFANTPAGGVFGTLSNYGWGKLYDLIFGGQAVAIPANWYAGLSTAALNKTATSPTEPSGNAYARAAIANDATHWVNNGQYSQSGDVQNGLAAAFPTPSGPWGTVVAAALCDATSGGNTWLVAPLTAAITPGTAAAPTFAAGSLAIGLG